MAGIFDLKTGAFDSSEAALLFESYDIALQGLRASHDVDRLVINRLARSIVRVVRSEPDCLNNDGTIDPVRLAQRAILRMLQTSAPRAGAKTDDSVAPPVERLRRKSTSDTAQEPGAAPQSAAKIMMRLFDRTPFAKV